MKRIFLIDADMDPDLARGSFTYTNYAHHPIGLLYLVAAGKWAFPDCEFEVFHTAISPNPHEEVLAALREFRPDLIGMRSLSVALHMFDRTAMAIREQFPTTPLISGGPYPSCSYEKLLTRGLTDLVVTGEGEATFVDLIARWRQEGKMPRDVPGTIVLDDNGAARHNPPRPLIQDLDAIPFPDYSMIRLTDYVGIGNHAYQDASTSAMICGSRGCPYKCFYCHQLFGKRLRRRSPANVVAEMREHIDKRGIRDFVFLDDIFNVPKSKASEMLRAIARDVPEARINFPNGLRADHLDEEILDLFEAAGTVQMSLAIESATPRIQKLAAKHLALDRAEKALSIATRRFIVCGFYIIGFPTETYEEALNTIKFAAAHDYMAMPTLNVLRIYRDSEFLPMLGATPEQIERMEEQEQERFEPRLKKDLVFYGDLFPPEKVPLKSADIARLRWEWLRHVFMNGNHLRNAYKVISKHLNAEQMLRFYRIKFDDATLGHDYIQRLLKLPPPPAPLGPYGPLRPAPATAPTTPADATTAGAASA